MFKNNPYMNIAFEEAKIASSKNEVPVGAALVDSRSGEVISKAHNLCVTNNNFTQHAEMIVISLASTTIKSSYLDNYDLYVTLEPCPMCAYAISLTRIRRLYFGCADKKSGGIENGPRIYNCPSTHHVPEVYSGIMEVESSKLLKDFFRKRRKI